MTPKNYFEDVGGLLGPYSKDFSPKFFFGSREIGSWNFGSPLGTYGAEKISGLKVHILCRCCWCSLFGTFPTFVPMGTCFFGPMTSHLPPLWGGAINFKMTSNSKKLIPKELEEIVALSYKVLWYMTDCSNFLI